MGGDDHIFTKLTENVVGAFPKKNTVDGFIERFNRRSIATFFVIFSAIASSEQLSGNTIKCHGFKVFKEEFNNDYCWTQGLFTNRYAYGQTLDTLPAPGIVPCLRTVDGYACSEKEQQQQRVFHLWYQWVPIYFALSCILYVAPYFIVKITMLGSIAKLVDEVEKPEYIGKEGEEKAGAIIVRWMDFNLYSRFTEGDHDHRSISSVIRAHVQLPFIVVIVKLLYLAVSVLHFYYTGKMFEIGNWYKLGLLWHIPESNNYTHIGDMLFPKMVGCILKRWGVTGIVTETGMCSLAPNVVNQYLFLVSWFMIVVTIGLNVLNVLGSLFELAFYRSFYGWIRKINPGVRKHDLRHVYAYFGLTGRMAVYKLAQNSPIGVFMAAMKIFSKRVRERARNNESLRKYFQDPNTFEFLDDNECQGMNYRSLDTPATPPEGHGITPM